MIKLNNKNITYVALADSNNSLKAPKEIWYADSSNSVKLVYRRKDALIEGEDYEKYHWLDGRNGAYIGTNYYPIVGTDVFSVHFHYDGTMRNPDGVEQCIFGCQNGPYGPTVIRAYINGANNLSVNYHNTNGNYFPSTGVISNNLEITDLKLDGSNYSFVANGVTYSFSNNNIQIETMPNPIWVFKNMQTFNSNCYFHGDIAYFKITDTSSNTKMSLIPCKLLKPVPKWLDANGIRRQIGECGMIDLVSGKFYGNVNSVGTFTVENYYERKEWLRVQTTTQTGNYLTLPLTSMNFSFQRIWLSDFRNTWYFTTPGYPYYTDNYRLIQIWDSTNSTVVNSGDASTINVGDTITIESTPDLLLMNGKTINRYNYVSGAVSLTNAVALEITSLTSSVTVDEAERYIPCTLTMDLPASMDANNIARTKGTSGMWDLVSDRFYGNVANSGTFKAVNLAEGVDYEVHQWLKGDGSAYINTNKSLVETDIITTKFVSIDNSSGYYLIYGENSGNFRTTTCIQLDNNRLAMTPTATNGRLVVNIQINSVITISHSATEILMNGTSIWQGASVFSTTNKECYLFATGTNVNHCFNGKVGYFNISDNLNLIPVKLLKSIPSEYDANGKARQAGECGMYDTVNDVFYGNVASSGSFTVSDDN